MVYPLKGLTSTELDPKYLGFDTDIWDYSIEEGKIDYSETVYDKGGLLGTIGYVFCKMMWALSDLFGCASSENKPVWTTKFDYRVEKELFQAKNSINKILSDHEANVILRKYDLQKESKVTAEDLRGISKYSAPLKDGRTTSTHRMNPLYQVRTLYKDGVPITKKLSVFARAVESPELSLKESDSIKVQKKKLRKLAKPQGFKLVKPEALEVNENQHIKTFDLVELYKKTSEDIKRNVTKGANFVKGEPVDHRSLEAATENMSEKTGFGALALAKVIDLLQGKEIESDNSEKVKVQEESKLVGLFGSVKILKQRGNKKTQDGVELELGRIPNVNSAAEADIVQKAYSYKMLPLIEAHAALGRKVVYLFNVSETGVLTLKIVDIRFANSYLKDQLKDGVWSKSLKCKENFKEVTTELNVVECFLKKFDLIIKLKNVFYQTLHPYSSVKTGVSMTFVATEEEKQEIKQLIDSEFEGRKDLNIEVKELPGGEFKISVTDKKLQMKELRGSFGVKRKGASKDIAEVSQAEARLLLNSAGLLPEARV